MLIRLEFLIHNIVHFRAIRVSLFRDAAHGAHRNECFSLDIHFPGFEIELCGDFGVTTDQLTHDLPIVHRGCALDAHLASGLSIKTLERGRACLRSSVCGGGCRRRSGNIGLQNAVVRLRRGRGFAAPPEQQGRGSQDSKERNM